MKKFHFPRTRLIAALLALVCVLGLLPGTAFAATPDTIKMDDCTHNGVKYESPALGTCCQTAQMEKQKEQIIVKSGWQKNSQIRINGKCRPKKQQKARGENVV